MAVRLLWRFYHRRHSLPCLLYLKNIQEFCYNRNKGGLIFFKVEKARRCGSSKEGALYNGSTILLLA